MMPRIEEEERQEHSSELYLIIIIPQRNMVPSLPKMCNNYLISEMLEMLFEASAQTILPQLPHTATWSYEPARDSWRKRMT
jgi:hypothetical protein